MSAIKSGVDFILAIQSGGGFNTSTPGSALIARFCRAVRNGEQPAREDMEALAMALEPIALATTAEERKDALAGFAKQSALDARLGRKDRSAKVARSGRQPSDKRYIHVLLYAIDRENGIDEMQARKLLMERANVGDRAARDMLRKYLEIATSERKSMLPFQANMKTLEDWAREFEMLNEKVKQILATRSSLEEKTRNI